MDRIFDGNDPWQCRFYELYHCSCQLVVRELHAKEYSSVIQSKASYDKGARINHV